MLSSPPRADPSTHADASRTAECPVGQAPHPRSRGVGRTTARLTARTVAAAAAASGVALAALTWVVPPDPTEVLCARLRVSGEAGPGWLLTPAGRSVTAGEHPRLEPALTGLRALQRSGAADPSEEVSARPAQSRASTSKADLAQAHLAVLAACPSTR